MVAIKTLRPYQAKAVKECWGKLKENSDPVLLMASVGSGKSLMISDILLTMQKLGKRALCLVNNAELVRNNSQTFVDQGGEASIYCAALSSKDIKSFVVFGTPQSILNAIKRKETLADIQFNLIVVDECHNINHLNHRSTFMRILRHYKQSYDKMRLLGATGTDFRFKGTDIVGKDCLFKSRVGNITTEWLIQEGYLVKPTFQVDPKLTIDFSRVKIKSNGNFDSKELEDVVRNNTRLTALIMQQIVHVMEAQNRHGCIIFASTKKHAYECAAHLPKEQTAVILGDMANSDRTDIFNKARSGEIRYIVNISIVSVGVDIPPYDTLAYLRPTDSLVLVVQTMGRVLRLSPGKDHALIIDCAGNIERHQDWDSPLLLEALKETRDKDADLIFPCPKCETLNGLHARRCIGHDGEERCTYYFEFKECENCSVQNDIAARQCRNCEHELIDPNAKLSVSQFSGAQETKTVMQSSYWVQEVNDKVILHAYYKCADGKYVFESYIPTASERAKNYFYGSFVLKHVKRGKIFYPHLQNAVYLRAMLKEIESPHSLTVTGDTIKRKHFEDIL